MKLLAGIDNLFDDFAQLVDLDREDAPILTAIVEFGDRVLEREVDRFDAVTEQILKANDERKTETAGAGFIYNLENIYAAAIFLKRFRINVAFGVDGEITATPAITILSSDCGLDITNFQLFILS